MARRPRKRNVRSDGTKPQERRDTSRVSGNKRLAKQTRKILRTHYASKYRVR